MKNLNDLIDQWIGEEGIEIEGYPNPFNEVRKDLKFRKQELIDELCKMLSEEVTNLSWEHENLSRHGDMPQDAYDRVLHFIDTLTKKFDA